MREHNIDYIIVLIILYIMHSTQRTLIELTKTPTIQQRIDRLMRETIGIVEKVALLMSMRT